MWYTRFGQSSNYSYVTSINLLDLHTKSWLEKDLVTYSGVHISSDEVYCKILKKPFIVQKKMIPHMKAKVVSIGKKQAKSAFFVFLDWFWAYVGQPHDHIGWATPMPFASINPTTLESRINVPPWINKFLTKPFLQKLYFLFLKILN